jgi:hypothetical protein
MRLESYRDEIRMRDADEQYPKEITGDKLHVLVIEITHTYTGRS